MICQPLGLKAVFLTPILTPTFWNQRRDMWGYEESERYKDEQRWPENERNMDEKYEIALVIGETGMRRKIFEKITRKLQNTIDKTGTKELQYSYRKGKPFWIMKSFSSCYWGIGCLAILLRLFSFSAVG